MEDAVARKKLQQFVDLLVASAAAQAATNPIYLQSSNFNHKRSRASSEGYGAADIHTDVGVRN